MRTVLPCNLVYKIIINPVKVWNNPVKCAKTVTIETDWFVAKFPLLSLG